MSTTSTTWTEETITLADTEVQMISGGTGQPLLILHDEMGHQSWLRYQESLAQHHKLYIPSHPGFGKTPSLSWIMNMRDMAGWYLQSPGRARFGPGKRRRLLPWRMAGQRTGHHVPPPIQKDGAGRAYRNQTPGGGYLRHVLGGVQGFYHGWIFEPEPNRGIPAGVPR